MEACPDSLPDSEAGATRHNLKVKDSHQNSKLYVINVIIKSLCILQRCQKATQLLAQLNGQKFKQNESLKDKEEIVVVN